MALRFEAEATSLVGIQWRIRIYDNEYGGSTVIPFKVGGDIFELSYDGADDDRLQYIIPSELSFTFIVTSPIDEELIDELRGSKEARYMVEVSYLETTYKPYWRGIIFSNQLQVVDEYYPQQVRITCSDDIKALDSIPYKVDEDTPYTGTATIASHLINCINKVRWISLNSSTRLTWEDFFFSSEQFATYGTALSNIALVHEALRETSDNGAINYRSTYEILHEILSLFGLRMFQVNGAFMCQSIFAAEADPANAEQGFLNNVEVTDTDTVARPTFSFGANYVRERGWTNGYLHPYNEVQRKYNFAGGFNFGRIENFPHNGYNGSNFANLSSQILSAAENVYEEGVAPALTFKFDYWIQEGTNWDLSEQVGLLRLSMTLNVGGYYLNRNMNVSASTTIPFYTYNDGDVNVPVASYGETTWVQNSSSRYRMFIAHEDMNWDHTRSHTLTITCPPLPADLAQSSVVQIGFQLDVYDPQATLANNSSYIAQFGNMRVTQLALLPSIGGPIDGSTVRYRVINEDANNRSVLELPETYVGDKMVDGINHVLKAYDGNLTPPWVSTETWYTLENSTPIYPVHKLQCYEILTGQNRIVPTQFGVLHERPSTTVPGLRMHSLLNAGSGVYWGIFNFTLSAYTNSYDISLWRLDRDVSDIQVPNDDYTHPIDNGTPGTGISNDTGPTEDIRVRNLQIGDAFKEISDTAATVSGLSVRIERLYDTFQPLDDDDHTVTKIVHEAGATTGMSVTLEEGTAQITSNSGNTYWSLGESSPGQMRVFVQDDATPTPNSVGAMFITAASNVGKVGINTSTPAAALDVVGNIAVSGTVDGVDVAARDAVLTDLNDHALLDILIYNDTGSTLNKGTVVQENGAVAGPPSALKASKFSPVLATLAIYGHRILGVLTSDVSNGAYGYARPLGFVTGLNTNAFNVGSLLYADNSVPGGLALASLTTGYYDQRIGWCTKKSSTAGEIYVRIDPKQYAFPPVALPSPPPGGYKSVLFQDTAGEQTYDTQFTYTDSTNTLSIGGTATTAGVLRLGEASNNGTNSIGLRAPASIAADTTYTLPSADGTSGQVLSTNGSAILSWTTPSAADVNAPLFWAFYLAE